MMYHPSTHSRLLVVTVVEIHLVHCRRLLRLLQFANLTTLTRMKAVAMHPLATSLRFPVMMTALNLVLQGHHLQTPFAIL
jgi:hypothetical protein